MHKLHSDFKSDLLALLEKHGAQLEASGNAGSFKIVASFNEIYALDNVRVREYSELNLGAYIYEYV